MKEFRFTAKIEPADRGHGFVFFPFDTQEEFGTRGQVRVQARFDGVRYAGALVKYAAPQHMLPVVKRVLKEIKKSPGDTVAVVLQRDESVRAVEVPVEFTELMKREGVLSVFEKLSFTHRKEYSRWIAEAKKEETRRARLGRVVAMLRAGVKTPD